jgi:predicted nucleotidyltransferase
MGKMEILNLIREHRAKLSEFDVQSLAVFGSVARDETTPGNDVDILVEFSGLPTFDKYMDVKIFLEDLLGHPVDLIVNASLRPQIRPFVEQDAIYVT